MSTEALEIGFEVEIKIKIGKNYEEWIKKISALGGKSKEKGGAVVLKDKDAILLDTPDAFLKEGGEILRLNRTASPGKSKITIKLPVSGLPKISVSARKEYILKAAGFEEILDFLKTLGFQPFFRYQKNPPS